MPSLTLDTPQLAKQYDQVSDLQYEHGQFLLAGLQLRPGEALLDVGCGTGRLAQLAARHHVGPGGRVVGVDPLPLRIALAQARALPQLSFAVARGEDLSAFDDQSFDAVLLNSVYHWLPDKAPVLAEIARVLRPGGRVAISSASRERPHDIQHLIAQVLTDAGLGRSQGGGSTPYRVTHAELAGQLETAGLLVDQIRLRRFADHFPDIDAVLAFSHASAFGNFLGDYVPEVRARLQAGLRTALAALATPGGILLHRNLHFALARKPG
ncbi:methyltransferase domain-containing protein [Chitiniphilus purpureus]|uniref:Methyltransferase domain-containing protein n=1 Tax=Chitiniphilus purpureus TaxID=2981137 RepID=A0ABY6DP93_9NEIS|nr:class I SAM-dependent methyltransferase [Chitiniphilus sp. CD1]UXY15503.1 methyltransferase domain-containing protein [Chitiniphilus sp. CD1]